MQRLRLLYPLPFAVFPVLSLAERTAGEYAVADLVAVLTAILVAFGVLQGLLTLVLRGRAAPNVPPAINLLLVAWFLYYIPISDWLLGLAGLGPLTRKVLLPTFGVLLSLVTLWWLLSRKPQLEEFSSVMSIAGTILVAWSGLSITASQLGTPHAVSRSAVATAFAHPITVDSAGGARRVSHHSR